LAFSLSGGMLRLMGAFMEISWMGRWIVWRIAAINKRLDA
jgi:hypothetical protein